MSNLTDHAREELKRAGLFDKDSDYGGMAGDAVMELIETFSKQEHSGYSGGMVLHIFNLLVRFKPLEPLTSDPAEWMEVDKGLWQNRRDPECFSKDGGKTWYSLSDLGEKRSAGKP